MNERDELVKECRKIWDMEQMEIKFAKVIPNTIAEMNKAIEEQVDFILSREDKIRRCEFCGSNDLVCGKAWKEEREKLLAEMKENREKAWKYDQLSK